MKHSRHVFAVRSCGCVCVCVYVPAGKSKVKASGKVRPLKGGGDSAAEEPMSPSMDVVSVASGRGLGGSAPATPTEAESTTNQSAIGSWSRNSLRGSKCNFTDFLLSSQPLLFHTRRSNCIKCLATIYFSRLLLDLSDVVTHLTFSVLL